jgi:hypothetical protein
MLLVRRQHRPAQLHAPACNLATFMRILALPETGIRAEALGDLTHVRSPGLAFLN